MRAGRLLAVDARSIPPRAASSAYPEPFRSRMHGREKRVLGEAFGLANFGVNLTRLKPGARSALLHRHTVQDEFVYILAGAPTLVTEQGEQTLAPGFCSGFAAGGVAHHLLNLSDHDVWYLEVGDRLLGDTGEYPQDDLRAELSPDGKWRFTRKDGQPYPGD